MLLMLLILTISQYAEAQLQNGVLRLRVDEGSGAIFPCNLDMGVESPYWLINGTIYTFDQVPPQFTVVGYAGLLVPSVTLDLDGFTFQCIGFDENGIVEEITTILTVTPTGLEGVNLIRASIFLDYNRLAVTQSSVVLPFNSTGCGPNTTYTFNTFLYNSTARMFNTVPVSSVNSSDTTFEISHLTNGSDANLLHQLSAVNENDTNCFTSNVFYRPLLQSVSISVHAPGDEVCVSIPSTPYCSRPLLVWPGNTDYCKCTPDFATCIANCRSPITIIPLENRVCFNLLSSNNDMNNTVLSFECSEEMCNPPISCVIATIFYAEKVIIAGPPAVPTITLLEGSLICFSAYSHAEYPVEYFSVDVRDAVGMTNSISGRYNTSQCISIPLPACGPFDVDINATNTIGTSDTASNRTGQEDDCACFHQQTDFNITTQNISTTSVTVMAICEINLEDIIEDGSGSIINSSILVDLNITILLEDGAGNIVYSSDLLCGKNVEFSQLQSSTNYSIVTPFRNSKCLLKSFRTQDASSFPAWVWAVIAILIALIILGVIITVVACIIISRRRKIVTKTAAINNNDHELEPQ